MNSANFTQPDQETARLPPGAPSWITPELIADTIQTWQPYYTKRLTDRDALEILLNVCALFDALEKA